MASINLAGRIAVPRTAISPRLLMVGGGVLVLLILGVIYGFHVRIKRQQERKEQQHSQNVASDAAASNRQTIEGEIPVSSLAAGAGPQTTTTSSAVGIAAPLVNAVKTVAHSFPEPTAPVPPSAQSQSITTASSQLAPPPSVPYYSSPVATPADRDEEIERRARQRRYARQQQAMEAPTGAQEQHASRAGGVNVPVDPIQNDIAQLNALVHPAGSIGGNMPSVPTAGVAAPGGESGSGYRVQNAQSEKRQFQEGGQSAAEDYLNTSRTSPLSRWVVQRGTVIPAALPHRLVSDLPGDLIAEVQRDVYDSPSQKYVMIPAGSRLVGEYNSRVSYGQSRVQVVWIAIYFPDGSFIDLDRMSSHAADGAVGLKDQVDNHWKRLIGGVALSSLLAAGLQVSQNHNSSILAYPSTTQEIGAAVGTQAAELGQQITNRNLNIQPTLKIRTGEIFAVSVKKDMVFPGPYEPLSAK